MTFCMSKRSNAICVIITVEVFSLKEYSYLVVGCFFFFFSFIRRTETDIYDGSIKKIMLSLWIWSWYEWNSYYMRSASNVLKWANFSRFSINKLAHPVWFSVWQTQMKQHNRFHLFAHFPAAISISRFEFVLWNPLISFFFCMRMPKTQIFNCVYTIPVCISVQYNVGWKWIECETRLLFGCAVFLVVCILQQYSVYMCINFVCVFYFILFSRRLFSLWLNRYDRIIGLVEFNICSNALCAHHFKSYGMEWQK